MTETTEVVQGVAEAAPVAPKRRVIGADAEAALAERRAKSADEVVVWPFRGKDYHVLVPTPAGVLLSAAMAEGAEGELSRVTDAIRSAFVYEDGVQLIEELMRTDVDSPADLEYLLDLLRGVLEATTGRPENS